MKKILSALALAACALTANAALVTTGTLTRGAFEYSAPTDHTVTGNAHDGSYNTGNVYIGAMNATFVPNVGADPFGNYDILMFCVDIYSHAGAQGLGLQYDKTDFLSPAIPFDAIGKLITFNGGLSSISAEGSAAMQMAIWELIYDDAPGDVTSGNFTVGGVSNYVGTNPRVLANALLAGAATVGTSLFDVSGLSDFEHFNGQNNKGGYQDYITASINNGLTCEQAGGIDCGGTVPEPGSMALAGLGLLGVIGLRRRTAKVVSE